MTGLVSGDAQLAARMNGIVRHRAPAAVALVTAAATTLATRGAGPRSDFEIGSISKAVTGLLYCDALERGEITDGTRLGDVLPLGECAASAVTLASLSTHSSGLPGLPPSFRVARRTVALWRHGTNPYGDSLQELLVQARGVAVGPPRPRYSNFGFMLLGHALASAAGTTYADLLRERIVELLDLRDTYVPATADQVRSGAVTGTSRGPRRREPWTGEALGPAGGIRSSVTDMARLTAAILDGSAPGLDALTPATRFGPRVQIGAAWITVEIKGRPVTWHNGGTGGFSSWIGIDRSAGTGVVVLSARNSAVDRAGFAILTDTGVGAVDHG